MATNDVSVELDDFGGNRENFLIPKKKKKEERAIESSNVANPQFEFDPFGVATPDLVDIKRVSDSDLESVGASRDATTGELILPLTAEAKDIYDAGFDFDNDNQNNNSPTGLFDNDTSSVTSGIKYSGGVKGVFNKLTQFKENLGFGGDFAQTILTGAPPIGTAMSWIATGWQQRKDQEKFLKDFGKNGFSNIDMFKEGPVDSQYDKTWEYAQVYGDPVKKTARDFARDIFFNNPNPSKLIKDNAYGGKNYEGSAFDATQDYIINGMKNGVFTRAEIKNVADGYNSLKMGSAEWVKAKMARDALKEFSGITGANIASPTDVKGGTESTSPTGTVYPGASSQESNNTVNTPSITSTPNYSTNDNFSAAGSGTTGSGNAQANPHTETGFSGGSNNNSNDSSSSGSYSSGVGGGASYSPNLTNRQYGGRVQHLAEGDMVQADAGNMEIVNEPGKDNSGVADDVPKKLEEGDFVVNAPASEMMGYSDLLKMIKGAEGELATQGVKVNYGTPDGEIDVRVSNKETIIPKVIAQQIGYDKLEKINNRGKKRVSEIEQANKGKEEQQGFMAQRVEPQKPNQPKGMLAAVGGQVSLDENKNQPIAVPQESFAGQSSVGSKLLSPMSPEAQDDEKELTDRSQSFEGFMKPIKLAEGDKVTQSFTKDEIERLIFKESSGNADAEVNNEKEHSLGLMQVGKLALDDVNKMYGTNYKFNDLRNADINREVGTNYLNILLNKYGNKELALAAYNYGMKNVGKDTNNDVQNFNNLPPKVQNYAKEILNIQIVEQPKTNTINPSGMMGK